MMRQWVRDLVKVHKAKGNVSGFKPHDDEEKAIKDLVDRIGRLETQITGLTAGSTFPQTPVA